MRVLLSTIGSRGEVQPLLGLATRIRELGHTVLVCAPPDFRALVTGGGFAFVPIGPEVRSTATAAPAASTPEARRRMIEGTVAAQFAVVPEAARGCAVVVGCGALQVAARSAAELAGAAYVHAHLCPVTLPSPHHAPPLDTGSAGDNTARWAADAQRWNASWGPALDAQRAAVGLDPVPDVRDHVFTDRPVLAADPVLGPWPGDTDMATDMATDTAVNTAVVQTGAWILPDERPLPPDLEAFLAAGEPPVYVGLGSMRAPGPGVVEVLVAAVRAVGRRAVVSRGWADLRPADDGPDVLSVGEVNHQALFPRMAAVVHHAGAGTTTTAALAGVPQVALPQLYDQPYWAGRIVDLGIGAACADALPDPDVLATALDRALASAVVARARALAPEVRTDGARAVAALVTAAPL